MSIQDYIWKDRRLTKNKEEKQVTYKLVDTDEYTLNTMYHHCKDMLYSTNINHLGRVVILDCIKEQLGYCGAELALRYFKSLKDINNQNIYTEENKLLPKRRLRHQLKHQLRHQLKRRLRLLPKRLPKRRLRHQLRHQLKLQLRLQLKLQLRLQLFNQKTLKQKGRTPAQLLLHSSLMKMSLLKLP